MVDQLVESAALGERGVPPRIHRLNETWRRFMVSLRIYHYTLGVGGTILATAVAAKPGFLESAPGTLQLFAWMAALCLGLMTATRPITRANAYARAWRVLNTACNRYALDPSYTMAQLLDAQALGEQIIESSDPSDDVSSLG